MITIAIATICAMWMVSYARDEAYEKGIKAGHEQAINSLNNLEEFCDALERLDEDIYLTWMREDGARIQLCIRGKDRELYAFSLPSDGSAEFVKVSDGKPMWYEDGSYSFAEEEN